MTRQTQRACQQWQLAALAALTVAVMSVAVVAAHADLIAAEPAAGSTVVGSPSTIRLGFSQPLTGASTIQLFSGQFLPVAGLTTSVAGSEMQAALGQPLAPATYTVQWRAATDDGHTTEGSYQFGVTPGGPNIASRLAPVVIATAMVLSVGAAIFVWSLNRRRRL